MGPRRISAVASETFAALREPRAQLGTTRAMHGLSWARSGRRGQGWATSCRRLIWPSKKASTTPQSSQAFEAERALRLWRLAPLVAYATVAMGARTSAANPPGICIAYYPPHGRHRRSGPAEPTVP